MTTYSYNAAGDLTTATYNDGTTPGITHTYNRRGQRATTLHNSMTTEYAYNDAGQLLSEIYSGGTLNGLSVTNGHDQYLRRTNLILLNSSSDVLAGTDFGYDSASRLQTVGSSGGGVTYGYLANSPLVSTVVFQQSGNTRMTTTKSYDNLNRLKSVGSALSPGLVVNSGYTYNSANQRTGVTNADGSFWVYTYDALGQVQSGAKYFSDNTIVPGQQFNYTFDDIGNRKTAKTGGDQNPATQRTANYTLKGNGLNQYDNRTVPGYADVLGVAAAGASVTVNSASPWRKDEYFRKELTIGNSSAVWQGVTVNDGTTTTTGNLFLPATPENYTYDLDGNLTQDGRWDYLWDAENRLTRMTSRSGAPSGSVKRLEFVYDHQGRRIGKKVWNNTAGTGDPVLNQKFVYDGWNLIAVLSSSSSLLSSFTWGLDLSGSIQGAGGVGGLLAVTDATPGTHFCAYDGNGNVRALVNAANGTVSAGYEYGPFGELIRKSGVMANANPFRFSTKYQDDESDQLYYGYRSYNPSTGRWLSRDPIAERGGRNLYGAVRNDAVNHSDNLGKCVNRSGGKRFRYEFGNDFGEVTVELPDKDYCNVDEMNVVFNFFTTWDSDPNLDKDAEFTCDGKKASPSEVSSPPPDSTHPNGKVWSVTCKLKLTKCHSIATGVTMGFRGRREAGKPLQDIGSVNASITYTCDCPCKISGCVDMKLSATGNSQ